MVQSALDGQTPKNEIIPKNECFGLQGNKADRSPDFL
jgi:hypothetical protein